MSAIERRSASVSLALPKASDVLRQSVLISATTLFIFVFLTAPGHAHAQEPTTDPVEEPFPGAFDDPKNPRVEVFLSSLFASSATEGSFGVRGSWHLKRRFALEGSLSRLAVGIDIFLADFSTKYYLRDRGRTDVYAVGGLGAIWADDFVNTETTLHLGIGLEVDLTKRLYFRPEIRSRWFARAIDGTVIGDLSLGLGWRI